MPTYEKTTHNIHVLVEPKYESDQSSFEERLFVFSYEVFIRNDSKETIQILRRSWVITDALFNIECVEGDGVVGEHPTIDPGKTFSYKSFCPLKTSHGTMKGSYHAVTASGKTIKIIIPEFVLAHPFSVQ